MHDQLRFLFVSIVLLCSLGNAQTTGTIRGSVMDVTGAVIPGVTVSATLGSAPTLRTTRTDAGGLYVLPVLPVGKYAISFSAPGFRRQDFLVVEVFVTETTTLNAHLQVAGTVESVTVDESTPALQTSGAQHGRLIEGNAVADLPLSTRNFTQLLSISPGAVTFLSDATGVGRNTQAISVNGARVTQNNYRINGVDANTLGTNGPILVPVPAPESIQEFQVQSSTYDASYGRAGGANIQILTRSGIDRWHGSAYEYFRNEALDANDGFLKLALLPRPLLHRNAFGGTLGGPIKTQRASFFVSYQGTRELNGASLTNSVSSRVLVAPGLTNDRSPAALIAIFHPAGPLDTRALALLNARLPNGEYLIPTPSPDGTFTASTPSRYNENQFNTNFDWRFGSRDLLSGKWFFANSGQRLSLPSFRGTGSNVPGSGSTGEFDNRIVSLQEIHTFSATAINEARFGYNFNRNDTSPNESVRDSDVGIPRSTANQFPGLPLIRIAPNAGGIIIGTAPAIEGHAAVSTWTAADGVTLVRGKHTLRYGGEVRLNAINFNIPNFSRGQIDFQSFNNFLLGQAQTSTLGGGIVGRAWRANDYDLFLQDDWRVLPSLMLNVGARYELDLPVRDNMGRLSTFDPSQYSPRMQLVGGNPAGPPSGGFVQAGNVESEFDLGSVPNVSNTLLHHVDAANLAPRVGFAWSPWAKRGFVVRAGYGIYYSRATFQYASQAANLPPYYVLATRVNPTLANPFPSLPSPDQFPTFVPGVLLAGSAFNRHLHTPYFQQFSAGFQYEIHRDLVFDLSYVGSRGTHLFRQLAINQALLASPQSPVFNPVTGTSITSNSPGNAQLRAPLQGVSINGFTLNETSGRSIYDSMQAVLTRRLRHGLQLAASYTWSKSIDNGSGAGGGAGTNGALNVGTVGDTGGTLGNQLDPRLNRGVSDFDRTHRFVANYLWEVPDSAEHAKALLRGWQLSGIAVAMSGAPIDVVDTAAGSLYGLDKGAAALARPNLIPGVTCATAMHNVPGGYYFDPRAFADPVVLAGHDIPSSNGTATATVKGTDIGDLRRNCLRGPSQLDFDIAIAKGFSFHESQSLHFKIEVFNAFNRRNLANPVSNLNAVVPSGGILDANTGAVISGGNFGKIIASSANPRIIQLSVTLRF